MVLNSQLLSVIVPVYKAEEYIHRCVDSIIAQTWSNLEIILVDDGSPDNSGVICDEYASKDSRIRVIHKANGGVSSARNAGIDVATGKYIAFVDSDDYIDPQMYEKLFYALTSDDSIAVCDFMMDYGNGHLESKITVEMGNSKIDTIKSLLLSDVGGGSVYMISPKTIIGNLRFPEYLNNGEDLWFVLRLFAKSERIVKIDAPLYYYYQSNDVSLTHGWSCDSAKKCVRVYEENYTFLKESCAFRDLKKEWAWSALRYKSVFLMCKQNFYYYKSLLPEANKYVKDCPLVSSGMKLMMNLLNHNLDIFAAFLLWLYRLKKYSGYVMNHLAVR